MTAARRSGLLLAGLLVLLLAGCGGGSPHRTDTGELQVAPVYTSLNHVLHLRVRARTETSTIAGQTYKSMDIYETSLVGGQGRFTPGTTSSYVGAQWSVAPGDTMIIDYINDLDAAQFTPNGDMAAQAIPQPINLHTHGLTVSPSGNSDNVLLAIPQHRSNRFVIKIPTSQYHGLYWYHPHIHGLTDEQVYDGLAGHIVVGRADGDYKEFNGLRVSPLMIRYNVRKPGAAGELVDASPYDTKGTALEYDRRGGVLVPRGRMIYTVNGQLMPRIKIRAARPGAGAESQIWAMTNITGSASYVLALDEVAAKDAADVRVKGRPVDFTIVSEDGTPMPRPTVLKHPARGYLLGQGGRVAILVQGPSDPGKVVRLLQVENRSGTGDASAHMDLKPIGGWRDYTRDVLAIGTDDPSAPGRHVPTPATLTTNYDAHFQHLDRAPIAHRRTFIFNSVATATKDAPNQFPINDGLFPFSRVDQPQVGTVEEWTILNYSSLHHPFHVHTQDAQVMQVVSPLNRSYRNPPGQYRPVQYVTDLSQAAPSPWSQDIVNVPPAYVDASGNPKLRGGVPVKPGKVVLRLRFSLLGEYVEHCHRLPHEDRGMMSLVRTIPHDPVFAVTSASAAGPQVSLYRSSDDQLIRTIVPFGRATARLATAIGNVDGDTIPDLAVASGDGMQTTVRIYSGASGYARPIAELHPFGTATSGASVAVGDLNGDGRGDIVAGSGAGGPPRVAVFDGETHRRLADFAAYAASFRGGVSVATGMIEEGGRISLVTGAGPGGPPTVNVYNFDLFGNDRGDFPDVRRHLTPIEVASFAGAAPGDRGGVSVATANPFAPSGGFSNVIVTPRSGRAKLRIFTIHQHMMDGQIDVAASGVMRPHDYQPGAPRMAMPAGTAVDLRSRGPAEIAELSTWTGAQILAVPRAGGPVRLWSASKSPVSGAYHWRVRTLAAKGTGVSGV